MLPVTGSVHYSFKISNTICEFHHHPGFVRDLKLVPSSRILVKFEDFAIIPPTTFWVG